MWRLQPWMLLVLLCIAPNQVTAEPKTAEPAPTGSAQKAERVDILFTRPGCVHANGMTSLSTVSALFFHFEKAKGTYQIGSGSLSALVSEDVILMPEKDAADGLAAVRLLKEIKGLEPETLAEKVGYLESPFDLLVELPHDGPVDWLQVVERMQKPYSKHADIVRRGGKLLRFTLKGGETFLALVRGKARFPDKIEEYDRAFFATADLKSPEGKARFLTVGRTWGSGHGLKAALDLQAKKLGEGTLKVHLGNLIPSRDNYPWTKNCAEIAGKQGYVGLVPGVGELARGPDGLKALAQAQKLPFAALNLLDAKTKERVFPGYRIIDVRGLKVALVGFVGTDQLEELPANVRKQWKVEAPMLAIRRLRRYSWKNLGKRPDLIVAMVSSVDSKAMNWTQDAWDFDLVLTPNPSDSMSMRSHPQTVRSEVPAHVDRSMSRYRLPLLGAKAGLRHLNTVSAFFKDKVLHAAEHHQTSVRDDRSIMDPAGRTLFRRLQEDWLRDNGRIFLPDLSDLVTSDPELDKLIRGGTILILGSLVEKETKDWPFISDPVWGRIVANIMRSETGADVALTRNVPRNVMIIGPLAKSFVEDWLKVKDNVFLVDLSGADLLKIRSLLVQSAMLRPEKLDEVLFPAGLDPASGRVGGRPVDPSRTYRVALTDAVADFSSMSGILAGKARTPVKGLRDLAMGFLERQISSKTGNFDPKNMPVIKELLVDQSKKLEARWDLKLSELSLTGAQYLNTQNTVDYSSTRETRLGTPDNLSISGAADLSLVYDGPGVAWETGFDAKIQHVALDIEGFPAQEAFDDAVLYTELRLNAAKISIGKTDVPLVPYVRSSYDTEFTATLENPSVPDVKLPHQHLLREALGFVLYPGNFVKEFRFGGLLQHDLSGDTMTLDGGLTVGLKLALPLGPVILLSDNELRYLFPDDDDVPSDLGFVFKSSTKLAYPVTRWFSLFTFADTYVARGKVEGFEEFAGSFILGLGLKLNHTFQL